MAEEAINFTFAIIAVLVVFAVIALLFTNIGQGIFEYLNKYLPGGSSTAATTDYKLAYHSSQALACSVNSVAEGRRLPCMDNYNKPSLLSGKGSPASISGTESPYPYNFPDPGQWYVGQIIASDGWFGKGYAGNALYFADSVASTQPPISGPEDISSAYASWIEDLGNGQSYKIHNFQLRQYFSEFEEWLAAAGDPQFLLYYQSFPVGEDSQWAGQTAWMETAGKVMMASFCAAHFLKPLSWLWEGGKAVATLKALKDVKMSNVKRIVSALGEKAKGVSKGFFESLEYVYRPSKTIGVARDAAKNMVNRAIVEKYGADNAFAFVAKEGIDATKEAEVYKAFKAIKAGETTDLYLAQYMSTAELSLLLPKVVVKKAIENPMFAAYMGIDTAAAYVLDRFDSQVGKFTDVYPNSLVLQNTMVANNLRSSFELGSNTISKPEKITDPAKENIVDLKSPLILHKTGLKVFNGPVPFYLVSPCQTDIEIKKEEMTCGTYSYDSAANAIICDSPSEEGWLNNLKNTPECGSLPAWRNTPFLAKETGLIGGMNVDIFPERAVSIDSSNLACCYAAKENSYEWLTKELCSVDPRRELVSDSKCSGVPKPSGSVSRKQVVDPIDGMTFYYDESTGIPDYFKKSWDCKAGNKYAEVEYDSGKGPSVWYWYNDESGKWMYAVPGLTNEYYKQYRDIPEDRRRLFTDMGIDRNPHEMLLDRLPSLGFTDGIKLIETTISLDSEFKRDDNIVIHYPDGTSIKTQRVDEKHGIYELEKLADLCNPAYEKIPAPVMLTGNEGSGKSGIDIKCHKYTLAQVTAWSDNEQFGGEDEIKEGLGEEGTDTFSCHLNKVYQPVSSWNNTNGDDGITVDLRIYFDVSDDSRIGKPFAMRIRKTKYDSTKYDAKAGSIRIFNYVDVVLNDHNRDGKLDEFGHYHADGQIAGGSSVNSKYSIFDDKNSDGTVDTVTSNDCKIDAISLTPDMSPYEKKNNYCYMSTYRTVLGLAETVGAFGASALIKGAKYLGAGTGVGWLLAAGVDCGLAYAEYKYGSIQWPG